MLVDEKDGNVFPLLGELVEGGFDGRRLGLVIDDEEVLLIIRRRCDVLTTDDISFSLFESRRAS